MTSFIENGQCFRQNKPTPAPNAVSYFWARRVMIQMNARGHAISQYMDPAPHRYAHAPTITAQIFMQPEQYISPLSSICLPH